ncbi:hypothetical protein PNOK_0397900 [Pyrrhoderma noxium]|uniref:Ribosome maturation protein SDO1/SBDS N-terminal domain-containing protein n=1 Tax=Pyrrhoderma noxium TaxID=2282107 RepID=A0A286UP55_9AGAM|nr:hypothetical protein PNOK_0397900 [Pyrrhoderma noxium]
MVKALTKVIFKPDSQSTEEYIMIVNGQEYKKWKEGGNSIPLTEVVDSFKIFVSAQGKQGHLGEASKQQLENIFGSSKDIVVAEKLLKEGVAQNADRLDDDHLLKNLSHGDFRMDTRGSGARTSGA